MNPAMRVLLSLSIVLVLFACKGDTEEYVCKTTMTGLKPTASHSYAVNVGQVVHFEAEPKACTEGENYGIRWMLNDEVVSYANSYAFVSCGNDIPDGATEVDMALSAQAITRTTVNESTQVEVVAEHKWTIRVSDIARPTRPSCYEQSMTDVVTLESSNTPEAQEALTNAAACFDEYLSTYACDFQASYASGLAKSALLGEGIFDMFLRRHELTTEDVVRLAEDQVQSIRENFLVVEQKADDDFHFTVTGAFEIFAFGNNPRTDWDETVRFLAYGRHDKSDALLFMAVLNFFDGFLNVGLANTGAIEFMMHTPDDVTPTLMARRLIDAVESDPDFLTLLDGVDADGNPSPGREGARLLRVAQNSFIQGLQQLSRHFDSVRNETHDQSNDLFRYWDCGVDAVCPAMCSYMNRPFNDNGQPDPAEYDESRFTSCEEADGNYEDRNLNGVCDAAWSTPAEGECNLQYDPGETYGTERIAFRNDPPERMGPSVDLELIQSMLAYLVENIQGPDPLPIDKMGAEFGVPVAPSILMRGVGLPYPEIRLSQFFTTPKSFRDMLPLYKKDVRDFIISLESEPFWDVGYDHVPHEPDLAPPWNPTNQVLGIPVEPFAEGGWVFDVWCNPDCNNNDGIDNSGTTIGLADTDPLRSRGIDNRSSGIPMDLGVEGNFMFDFVDKPHPETGRCDGEFHEFTKYHEPFDDIGVIDANGNRVGRNNGLWDRADRFHQWPTGPNIGPVSDLERDDDPPNGQIDNYYFLFQDPTFSGTVRFIETPNDPSRPIVNSRGEVLPDHARLHLFISRTLGLAEEFGFRESNAHRHVTCP